MNLINTTKTVTGLVGSFCVGTVVGAVIKNNLPEDLPRFQRISIIIGTSLIGGMAGSAATKHIHNTIDTYVDAYNSLSNEDPS